MSANDQHTPLHLISPGRVRTAGRAELVDDSTRLANAHASVVVEFEGAWTPGALMRVVGDFDGEVLSLVAAKEVSDGRPPRFASRGDLKPGESAMARAALNRSIRAFFEGRSFLEVETQALVPSPGTDVHLDPVSVELRAYPGAPTHTQAYLHTSPEFAMKRLLCAGMERIYQLSKVWRNGEVTAHHNPEFTLLEWYRAWEDVDAIIDDTEELVREVLPERFTAYGTSGPVDVKLDREIPRVTMQQVVDEACGFDILECLEVEELREAIARKRLFDPSAATSWSDLFAELQVVVLDPFLAAKRAIFVTHWPTPVAVLARRDPEDPRQSERFELYVGGLELANGFGELTDHTEQRERFESDDQERVASRLPRLPLPDAFLEGLRDGMPPSAGVALGVDRLLMLQTGARNIGEVAPFAIRSDSMGRWTFG